jgi:hypothetical protein
MHQNIVEYIDLPPSILRKIIKPIKKKLWNRVARACKLVSRKTKRKRDFNVPLLTKILFTIIVFF